MADAKPMPVRELCEALGYFPETGVVVWLVGTRKGMRADRLRPKGYRDVSFRGARYRAHRVALAIAFRRQPGPVIDHINGDPGDNRLANLREVDASKNQANRHARRHKNRRGVCLLKSGRWMAQIKQHGRNHYLGTFSRIDDAQAAYDAKAIELYGEFCLSHQVLSTSGVAATAGAPE